MKYATCHPERKHMARGWCAQCYTNAKQRKDFVKVGRARKQVRCGHDSRYAGDGLCQACYSREHRRKNPEKRRRWAHRAKIAVYGLTEEAYDALYKAQEGRCAICRDELLESRRIHIDHNHQTGKVRGLLCSGCNRALGMLGDSVAGVRRALEYLIAADGDA